MRNLTIDVAWMLEGAPVAHTTQFISWVGVYTSLRPGVASLTEDTRLQRLYTVPEWMAILKSTPNTGPSSFVMRQAMIDRRDNLTTFEEILAYLEAAPLAGPGYLILAGAGQGEGGIIERNFTSSRTLRLGKAPTTPYQSLPWALIETNWDWDKPEPTADPRRAKATKLLESMGQESGATLKGLLGVLSTEGVGPPNASWPNSSNGLLNAGTAFTVALVPGNSTLRSYLRDSHTCCA
jgi:hypothetical protein